MVRALASHELGLGLIQVWYFRWVEFVVGSHLVPRGLLWVLWFSSLNKTQRSKFQFDQDRGTAWKMAKADVIYPLHYYRYYYCYYYYYYYCYYYYYYYYY